MKNLNMLPDMNATPGYATDTNAQPVPSRVHASYLLDDASHAPIASPEPPSVTLTDGDNLAIGISNGSKISAEEWDEKWEETEHSPLELRHRNSVTKILTLVGGTTASHRRTFSGDSGNGDGGSADGDDAGASGSECGWFIERMSAYQDGELENNDTRLVAAHIEGCTRCTRIFTALQATDNLLQREWRDSAPLPSSSSSLFSTSPSSASSLRFERAIDGIMAALPEQQIQTPAFPSRRVHVRTRWMRFATGIACTVALVVSLWISYQLGYRNGRQSVLMENASLPFQSSLFPVSTPQPDRLQNPYSQNSRPPLAPITPPRTNS